MWFLIENTQSLGGDMTGKGIQPTSFFTRRKIAQKIPIDRQLPDNYYY